MNFSKKNRKKLINKNLSILKFSKDKIDRIFISMNNMKMYG